MRIEIKPSARQHGLSDDEIRAVVSDYLLRFSITARRPGAKLCVYVGPAAEAKAPYIEVIADHADHGVVVVFHAMLLRTSTVQAANLDQYIDINRIAGRQRR